MYTNLAVTIVIIRFTAGNLNTSWNQIPRSVKKRKYRRHKQNVTRSTSSRGVGLSKKSCCLQPPKSQLRAVTVTLGRLFDLCGFQSFRRHRKWERSKEYFRSFHFPFCHFSKKSNVYFCYQSPIVTVWPNDFRVFAQIWSWRQTPVHHTWMA